MFSKVPQSSQTESLGFPRVPPPPLGHPGTLKNPIKYWVLNLVIPALKLKKTGWWFQRFFIFIPIWGKFPILTNIFQMGGSTTNQKNQVST